MSAADSARITILVENWIDMLLPTQQGVTRCGLIHHFDPKHIPVQAENGISFAIETTSAGRTSTVLFDCGLTPSVICHNIAALGVDATGIDHIVISHGHPDHYGGIGGILPLVGHAVPVATHPDAFEPRYAVMRSGEVAAYYNLGFDRSTLEQLGARFVLAREPLEIAPGITTTGEIPLENDFEGPVAPVGYRGGLFQVKDGRFELDQVMDEVALVVNVRDQGLIVLTGCGHRGVVNSIHRAQRLLGIDKILAVMGGFHLGFPGIAPENITKTLDALEEMEVGLVLPMHCSGLRTLAATMDRLPRRFVQYAVGTRLEFGEGS